jgi:hypothetical protein
MTPWCQFDDFVTIPNLAYAGRAPALKVRFTGKSGEFKYAYRYLAHRFSEARMGAGLR